MIFPDLKAEDFQSCLPLLLTANAFQRAAELLVCENLSPKQLELVRRQFSDSAPVPENRPNSQRMMILWNYAPDQWVCHRSKDSDF